MSETITINENNWQYASEINKLIDAVNERRVSVGLPSIVRAVAKQTNIQESSFWNNITTAFYECSTNPHIYMFNKFSRISQLNSGDIIADYIKTSIRALIRHIEVSSIVDIDGIDISVPYTKMNEDVGCNYPEVTVASGSFETPYLDGYILFNETAAVVDDYLIINGARLNDRRLVLYVDDDCGNVLGERKYKSLVINKYTARQVVPWSLVDTKRGYFRAAASLAFAPHYKYYPYDGVERVWV